MINSVALISKSGRILVSRKFTHEKHSQIEGHLSAFPKLVASSGHNYIDTETVRFIYQEINELYFVIVVSKDSNIVEDLEMITQFVDVTRLIAGELSEDKIVSHGLDLIFAFDECVFDGFGRFATTSDIAKRLKMDSAEENEAIRIRAEKEAKATEEMNRKLAQMKDTHNSNTMSYEMPKVTSTPTPIVENELPKMNKTPIPKGGMVLNKSVSSAKSKINQVMAEEGLTSKIPQNIAKESGLSSTGLSISLSEKLSAVVSRVGAVREISCEGRLIVSSIQPISAEISLNNNATEKYRLKPMQQPDRKMFSQQSKLVYNNTSGSYPPGSEVNILGWRMVSDNPADLPISINCWIPQSTKTNSTFSCEVELKNNKYSFNNIQIEIPLLNPREVNVSTIDGEYEVFERAQYLKWNIDQLNTNNPTAEIEFSVSASEEDSFFPVNVSFELQNTLIDIDISDITIVEGNSDAKPVITKTCVTSKFEIE